IERQPGPDGLGTETNGVRPDHEGARQGVESNFDGKGRSIDDSPLTRLRSGRDRASTLVAAADCLAGPSQGCPPVLHYPPTTLLPALAGRLYRKCLTRL